MITFRLKLKCIFFVVMLTLSLNLGFIGVSRICFTSVFGSGFILGIVGWIGNLCDFSLRVFI